MAGASASSIMSEPPPRREAAAFRPTPPLVIGLLGGVAAGKSTVARLFGTRGLAVVDADAEARAVTDLPEVRSALRQRFGARIFDGAGALDRARLADLVFADPAARRDLEAITHPRIRAALEAQIETARRAGTSVVLDVPLLLEHGLIERCDLCVFVESAPEVRSGRALGRGWSDDEISRREANQASLAMKRTRAAFIIRNDGSLEDTERQIAELLHQLGSPH